MADLDLTDIVVALKNVTNAVHYIPEYRDELQYIGGKSREIADHLSDIDVTLSIEITALTDAVEKLADEVRLAGASDFITERRKVFQEIRKREAVIESEKSTIKNNIKKQSELMRNCKDCSEGAEVENSEEYQTCESAIDKSTLAIEKLEKYIDSIIDLHKRGISIS